jgi:hypothetical protein
MKTNLFWRSVKIIPFTFLLFVFPALAANTSLPATFQSPQVTSNLLQQLEAAKSSDWDLALDPTISSVRQETFLNHMNKADRAIKELSHGFTVPQSELDEALWIAPKHITAEKRAQLIEQLRQARQQDDHSEQRMLTGLAWSNSVAPVDTVTFDQRKAQVDAVIKNLEIGAPVHYSDINQALVVPTAPY